MQTVLPRTTAAATRRPPADDLIRAIADMPFADTGELASAINRSPVTTRQRLNELAAADLVQHSNLGAPDGSDRRWWLDPAAYSKFGLTAHFYNTRRGMGLLAARVAAMTALYRLAQRLDLLRPDHRFQWHSRRAYDAVAGQPQRWTALFWSGIWEDHAAVRRRLYHLGRQLTNHWPSLLAFATPDHWQARILSETLDDLRLTAHAAVLVTADDTWTIPPPPNPPRAVAGWPTPPRPHPPPRPGTAAELNGFLERQGYLGRTGSLVQRILPLLEQWPGIRSAHIRALLPEKASGSRFAEAMTSMERLQLATREDKAYYPGPPARVRAAHRDRVSHRRAGGRMTPPNANQNHRRRLRTHDWATVRSAAMFQDEGCHVAAGWRAIDDAGPAGKIDPDAMIFLRSGPYGPGWHYFEWERRARSPSTIAQKLSGYRMPLRSNDWPVIFVVANPNVQRLFWEQGQRIKLITAAAPDNNPPREWSCFGTPVRLNSTNMLL